MKKLKIVHIFKSIDGEAYHSGKATLFLRAFGCNLRCGYCDTVEALTAAEYAKAYGKQPLLEMTPQEAFDACVAIDKAIRHITITGGEPLLPSNQPWMKEFAQLMLAAGYEVDFETNGAVDYTDMIAWREGLGGYRPHVHFIMDWKCPGSGMTHEMKGWNLSMLDKDLDIVKCVVTDTDFEEVESIIPKTTAPIYISPCWGKVDLTKLADFVLAHPYADVRVQFQIHKLIYGANDRMH